MDTRWVELKLDADLYAPAPPEIPLEPLLDREWAEHIAVGDCGFRLLSWNVLAAGLGDDQFSDRRETVCWGYRSQLLLQEIERSKADVVALYEVNKYNTFWVPKMKELGFDGHVRVEKAHSPCMHFFPAGSEDVHDGCAIFFKTERFELLEDYSQPIQPRIASKVAAIAVLLDRVTEKPVCVVGTHLTMGGKRGAVRGEEMRMLLSRVDEIITELDDTPAILLCGDWNEPVGQGVEALVRSSRLGGVVEFTSAYEQCQPQFTAQDFTATWCSGVERPTIEGIPHGAYMDSIDFIYHSGDFGIRRTWREPEFDQTLPNGIPSARYPSDHVAIAVDVVWSCLLYTSPSPRDRTRSRMPSSA
eukprot:TRINITY_DN27796_c0_g1_i2.p1 TRINITY_DN27796_c0_g1~~TRINITY_DN27796_c0_g1_i2.p1  ORF type:complete len:359 (-),score=63.66 TRINITY_DN27796_c0_g1_i2:92-1168(-)